MKTYCQHCGSVNEFTAVRPKFCQGCGQPFDKSAASVSRVKPMRLAEKDTDDSYDDDDYDDGYEYPANFSLSNIKKLEVEIIKPSLDMSRLEINKGKINIS